MNPPRPPANILCADIGTSSLKAALIDVDGGLRAFAREPYPAERVLSGVVHAADWAEAFQRAIRNLQAALSGTETAAVCISGNGPTLVPVNGDGTALPPLHWHDGRSAPLPGRPSLFLPRAAWLKLNQPEAYQRVRWLLSSQEWLSFRLGADPCTVLPAPAYGPYYWDAPQLADYGLDPAKFPPFVAQGARIGTVSSRAAAEYALPAGVPVIAGGPDFIMALVGVGAVQAGLVCDRAGTSEGINVCSDRPARSAELRTLPHLREGLWNVGAMLPTTGRLFEWFRHITGQQDRNYHDMLAEIVGTPSRDLRHHGGFFFPDIRASGALSGPSAFISTAGLTTRPELGRAVVEAIGYLVRGAVDTLERHGYRIEGMRLSGGQAKNVLWNQLKADITGRYLEIPHIEDGELAGDACAAMTALGAADSLEQAIEKTVRIVQVYEPNQKAYALHAERYDQYRTMLVKMERFLG